MLVISIPSAFIRVHLRTNGWAMPTLQQDLLPLNETDSGLPVCDRHND
ncbi:hypothetical protein [Gloeothece citriformis]|nr:hypothetical protein [Gloeothece citriformis]